MVTAAQNPAAINPETGKTAEQEAIEKVVELMKNAGVKDKDELAGAGEVYKNVVLFLRNTGFNVNLLPPDKY